jgi:hypothetical protein
MHSCSHSGMNQQERSPRCAACLYAGLVTQCDRTAPTPTLQLQGDHTVGDRRAA